MALDKADSICKAFDCIQNNILWFISETKTQDLKIRKVITCQNISY